MNVKGAVPLSILIALKSGYHPKLLHLKQAKSFHIPSKTSNAKSAKQHYQNVLSNNRSITEEKTFYSISNFHPTNHI